MSRVSERSERAARISHFIGAAAGAALVGGLVTTRTAGQDSNMKPMMMKKPG